MTHGSAIYFGRVMHRRLRPVQHRFVYRVFSLLLDIDDVPHLAQGSRLFSHNRWNLFSFHDKDHGPRDGTALRPWIESQLRKAGIDTAGGPVRLLCFPRMFGYVFNPLSVWFCHRPDGELAAVLYEVSNTFGEHHGYLLEVPPGQGSRQIIRQSCAKRFYVSPFIDMAAVYRFRLREPGERLAILIREAVAEGELLIATLEGQRAEFRDAALLRAALAYPLMTLKVFAAIHWEALRLWRKGVALQKRGAPPAQAVTYHALPTRQAAE